MELLLIRHALPIRRELTEGRADPELADIGHQQAAHLASYLAEERIDTLYASPMLRARQTRRGGESQHLDWSSRTASPSTTAMRPGTYRSRS